MSVIHTIDELKPHLQEMYSWYFQQARKLALLDKPTEEQTYEYGKACGADEVISAICIMIGMPVYDMWQAELKAAEDKPELS